VVPEEGRLGLFYKVAISVPGSVADQRHENDQSEEQGEKTERGQRDHQAPQKVITSRLASTVRRLVAWPSGSRCGDRAAAVPRSP
jgi:hypothetical protein